MNTSIPSPNPIYQQASAPTPKPLRTDLHPRLVQLLRGRLGDLQGLQLPLVQPLEALQRRQDARLLVGGPCRLLRPPAQRRDLLAEACLWVWVRFLGRCLVYILARVMEWCRCRLCIGPIHSHTLKKSSQDHQHNTYLAAPCAGPRSSRRSRPATSGGRAAWPAWPWPPASRTPFLRCLGNVCGGRGLGVWLTPHR